MQHSLPVHVLALVRTLAWHHCMGSLPGMAAGMTNTCVVKLTVSGRRCHVPHIDKEMGSNDLPLPQIRVFHTPSRHLTFHSMHSGHAKQASRLGVRRVSNLVVHEDTLESYLRRHGGRGRNVPAATCRWFWCGSKKGACSRWRPGCQQRRCCPPPDCALMLPAPACMSVPTGCAALPATAVAISVPPSLTWEGPNPVTFA